jgi:hypothetical protein
MHIGDEHIQKETKKWMKWMFISRSESARTASTTQQPLHPPVPEPPTPDDSDEDIAPATLPQSHDSFQGMAARHSLSAQEDETDREPVTIANIIGRIVKLVELFNFINP